MFLPNGYELNKTWGMWLLYLLVDGIYPPWDIFAGPNSAPATERDLNVTKQHEAIRKDIERLFWMFTRSGSYIQDWEAWKEQWNCNSH